MTQVADKLDQYIAAFERLETDPESKRPDWLFEIRKEAFASLLTHGFPHSRQEEWRHTNVSPIVQRNIQIAESKDHAVVLDEIRDYLVGNLDAYQLVFINGWYEPQFSSLAGLPEGVRVESIASILKSEPARLEPYLARKGSYEDRPFAALNTAFIQDGVYIHIPNHTSLDRPIHFLYYSKTNPDPQGNPTLYSIYPRNVIVAGKSSQATIVESYAGDDGQEYLTNAVTEVSIAPNASVEHCKLQRESKQAFHITFTQVHLDRDSQYNHHAIKLGSGFVRNDVSAILDEQGIHCRLNGLSLENGKRHVDNHTWIRHAKPHCESHELYKGILDEQSTGVFKGQIFVAKDAQKTDAKQTNQTLLLSKEAEIHSMPQLEIYADDVKCTHGSTTGHLEEEAVFYLQTRGLNQQAARSLLTYAFASEIVNFIGVEAIREQLDRLLKDHLKMD